MKAFEALTFVLIFAGIADSVYLTYLTIAQTSCPLSGGCDLVIASPYSKINGIPLSILGIIGFALILISFRMKIKKAIFALGIIGIATIIYLQYLQIFNIGAICSYCTLAHALYIASFLASYYAI